MRVFFSILLPALVTQSVFADWTATGTFNYTDRTYQQSGFTGTAPLPCREVDVEIYDAVSMAVLASGATDSNGAFSIVVSDNATRTVAVRVLASTDQTPSLDFSVVDDVNGDAVYTYHDASTDVAGHGSTTNVNFGTMTMPASIGTVASTDWSSQVFNTLDLCIRTADWIASVDGSRPAVGCFVGWNPTQGRTGSFYNGGSNKFSLSDDDGYDDPNILHELGHYVEDEYGRSRNTGGAHTISDDDQDPRLAWSEGFATYVSGATLEFSALPFPNVYIDRDSFGTSGGGGFGYNFELAQNGGGTNEGAVQAALWDLLDSSASLDTNVGIDDDALSGLGDEVWGVLEEMRVRQTTATSMEDFWDIWRDLGNGSETAVQTVFAGHQIDYQMDASEPNDTRSQATPLTSNYAENTFYRSGPDSGGDEDWFQFSATAGTYYRIEINGSANQIFSRPDPEIWLIDTDGNTVLAYSDDPHDTTLNVANNSNNMNETVPEIIWQAPSSGTYFVYCRHSSYDLNREGRYGTYKIRVTTSGAPTPLVTSVVEQRMLPGQSYDVLITGDHFSQGAIVSTSSGNVAVSNVRVISSSALVATFDVAGGAANGTFNVTVTNPGGSGTTSTNAFEISNAAQPPMMITEVDLGNPDFVEVKNLGTVTATLTGWKVTCNMPSSGSFTFPAFTLAPGATVRISENGGTNTATDLFDPNGTVSFPWNSNVRGDVNLIDEGNRNVDYIRFVSKYSDVFVAPEGSGGGWMQAERAPPSSLSLSVSRDEDFAAPHTSLGMSNANPTMPAGPGNRDNAVDAYEPNDTIREAALIDADSSLTGLAVSPRPATFEDEDWFGVPLVAGDPIIIKIEFGHSAGNLELEVYAPGEETTPLASSLTTSDDEIVQLPPSATTSSGSGIYRIRVFGNGTASNDYSLEILDNTVPSVPDLTELSDSGTVNSDDITNITSPVFTGTALPGATIAIFSNEDGQVGTGFADGSGNWTIQTNQALTENIHNITATANGGSPGPPLAITVDLTPPAIPSVLDLLAGSDGGQSNTDNITNDNSPSFTGTSETGVRVVLMDGASQVGATNSTGTFFLNSSSRPDGVRQFSARASDLAGNASALTPPLEVTIDTVAPSVTINQEAGQLDPVSAAPIQFTALFSETVFDFVATDIAVSGAGAGNVSVSGTGSAYTVTVGSIASEGNLTATVVNNAADDLAGNRSNASTSSDNIVHIDLYGSDSGNSSEVPFSGNSGSISGTIGTGDIDVFSFDVDFPRELIVQTLGTTDTFGRILDTNGEEVNDPLVDADDGTGLNFKSELGLAPGTYYVEVTGTNGDYILDIQLGSTVFVQPDITIGNRSGSRKGNDVYNISGSGQKITVKLNTSKSRPAKYFFGSQNDSAIRDSLLTRANKTDRNFKFKYFQLSGGRRNVTGAISRAGLVNENVLTNQTVLFQCQVKRKGKIKGRRKNKNLSILLTSAISGGLPDRATGKLKGRP